MSALSLGYFWAAVATLAWGLIVLAVRGTRTPGHIGIAVSLPVGVAVLLAALPLTGETSLCADKLLSPTGLYLLLGGLLEFPLATLCYYECLQRAEISTAVPLTRLKVVFVAALVFLLAIEPLTIPVAVASVLAVAGAFVLTSAGGLRVRLDKGALFALGASLCWAVGDILVRQALASMPALPATFWALCLGGAAYYVILIALGWTAQVRQMPRADILRFATHGALSFGLGYFAFFASIQLLGVTKAAVITSSWPLVSFLAGIALCGEKITARKALGVALIMISVFVVVLK